MSWYHFREQLDLANRIGGAAGRALERSTEDESKVAYARAVDLARAAVLAAEQGRPRTALDLLGEAGSEATQVSLYWWSWLDDHQRDGRAA